GRETPRPWRRWRVAPGARIVPRPARSRAPGSAPVPGTPSTSRAPPDPRPRPSHSPGRAPGARPARAAREATGARSAGHRARTTSRSWRDTEQEYRPGRAGDGTACSIVPAPPGDTIAAGELRPGTWKIVGRPQPGASHAVGAAAVGPVAAGAVRPLAGQLPQARRAPRVLRRSGLGRPPQPAVRRRLRPPGAGQE